MASAAGGGGAAGPVEAPDLRGLVAAAPVSPARLSGVSSENNGQEYFPLASDFTLPQAVFHLFFPSALQSKHKHDPLFYKCGS